MTPADLLELLKLRGWSQARLARELHTEPSTVSRWASGKVPMSGATEILLRQWLEAARAKARRRREKQAVS